MVPCEFPECRNEASGRCSQDRYPCGRVYCIKHFRAVRGIVWCDLCWDRRVEAERHQEIRSKKAERAFWIIGASSIMLGYGSMLLLTLYLQYLEDWRWPPSSAAALLFVFGGTILTGAYFAVILSVWAIREWLHTPPSDR